ncbi:hypothetical protein [Acidovorax sp. SUPP3334]|uniref:hypothetical protein n=1 Tax=Acidovorax sp. SUPP3334 TaxID=2920881 RepID=UPI0023DE6AB3|nr:hypothetical protein [Acidovorax sp. SUPP3334]GKT23220.1 CesT family type III secretion system chaperone [Acidovorax sp. SUPP3334]
MKNEKPKPSPRSPVLSTRRKACIREAALQMGADAAIARTFGETGETKVGTFTLSVKPLSHQEDGPWVAIATMARPDRMPEETWTDALLLANGQSMLSSGVGYGLEDNGDAVLVRRLETQQESQQLLAVQLCGLLAMCQATREGAQALGAAPQPEGGVR